MSLPNTILQLHGSPDHPTASGTTHSYPPPTRVDDVPNARGRNAFNSERPFGVAPAPEGGVAIGGKPNLPMGHANLADKIVGKTEKVIGKYTRNPELHEKGELRETGGKAAVEDRARAAHD